MRLEGGDEAEVPDPPAEMQQLREGSTVNSRTAWSPYKHYASEVISGVLDGIVSPDDEDSADYPCETTMRRWHCWLEANRLRIDGYLKSTGYRLLGFSTELLESRVSLLDKLRSSRPEWLETLLRFLYNSGGFLVPV